MIRIVEYTDEYESKWVKYTSGSPRANIAHQIGWLKVIEDGLGHKPRYILALEDDVVKGILPMAVVKTWWSRRYIISLPWIDYGGICCDNQEVAQSLVSKAQQIAMEEKSQFIEFRSVETGTLNLDYRSDKVTFLLKLNRDPDLLWKGFGAKLRNQVRKSQKSELSIEFGGIEKLPMFYKIFSWKMHDLGTPVWGYGFFESIMNMFSDSAQIILIKKEGKDIATGLVLSYKDRLYVPSAASYRNALKYCPNHALYWEVIKKGCDEGYKYFDFGRSAIDSNTYKFKKQWVGDPTPLYWQYYLNRINDIPSINPHNPKYKILTALWRKMPLTVANWLGPKVIKNFP